MEATLDQLIAIIGRQTVAINLLEEQLALARGQAFQAQKNGQSSTFEDQLQEQLVRDNVFADGKPDVAFSE